MWTDPVSPVWGLVLPSRPLYRCLEAPEGYWNPAVQFGPGVKTSEINVEVRTSHCGSKKIRKHGKQSDFLSVWVVPPPEKKWGACNPQRWPSSAFYEKQQQKSTKALPTRPNFVPGRLGRVDVGTASRTIQQSQNGTIGPPTAQSTLFLRRIVCQCHNGQLWDAVGDGITVPIAVINGGCTGGVIMRMTA